MRNNNAMMEQSLGPPPGMCITVSMSSFAGPKVPTRVEDGNFRLGTWFLAHCLVTSPPTNQKKTTPPAVLTPSVAYKNSSKTIREFGVFLSISRLFSLFGPAVNLSLLQTLMFQFVFGTHCASGTRTWVQHHHLVLYLSTHEKTTGVIDNNAFFQLVWV